MKLREVIGAGEPLNPEVIEQVRAAWGLTIRDGYGQTETTALIGNTPGQKVQTGVDGQTAARVRCGAARSRTDTRSTTERSRCRLTPRPVGLMHGYLTRGRNARARGGLVPHRGHGVAQRRWL